MSTNKWPFSIVVMTAVLSLALLQGSAWAETGKVAPGDQKIAQALFEAQSTKTLTYEQILAMKSSQGWGQVFQDMKKQGLLPQQKNLGQVVSQLERKHPEMAKIDTKAETRPEKIDRTTKPEKPAKPERMERPERVERPGR